MVKSSTGLTAFPKPKQGDEMSKVIDQQGHIFDERRQPNEQWHLDKKVTIGLIFFLIVQTISGVWYTSEIVSMVKDHERRLLIAEAFENRVDGDGKTIAERLGRLEERSNSTLQSLQHIETMMELQQEHGGRHGY